MLPILYLVYNRLDLVKFSLSSIKLYKPNRLYIASDGPKNKEDYLKCKNVRDYILSNINWECEVITLFRDNNLGCGRAVSSSISWFFENEEAGVILEEDCVPNLDFYFFCEKMINLYREDNRVMHVTGCNFVGLIDTEKDYFFSSRSSIWGWATWKRAWYKYEYDLNVYDKYRIDEYFSSYFSNDYNQSRYWKNIVNDLQKGLIDTWDFQWQFSIWKNKGVCIFPSKNLVKNIGFHVEALHTTNINSPLANLATYPIEIGNLEKKTIKILKNFEDFLFYFLHKENYSLKLNETKKIKSFKVPIYPELKDELLNSKYSFRDKLHILRLFSFKKISSIYEKIFNYNR